eukprot:Lithocolla_globosa_v1_NODE_689_length_3433_cov_2.908526.p2 type:complete len:337 gc:universal NODE_689_length_3433_cov_2.908526:2139-1129(-)
MGRKKIHNSTHFGEYLIEVAGDTVDERRHGDPSLTHMPFAISMPDIMEIVTARLLAKNKCETVEQLELLNMRVPTVRWVKFQFSPKSWFIEPALSYTGRFPVVYKIQHRQLRRSHEDSYFYSSRIKYQRTQVIKFNKKLLSWYACLDDKCKAAIGEPDMPIATGVKPLGPSPALENQKIVALDHDFHKVSCTPSVTLLVDPPTTVTGSWYRGQAIVSLKNTITQPSTRLRHAVELVKNLRSHYAGLGIPVPPAGELLSDKGPDHNVTFPSVQLSLILIFLALDLDFLGALTTCPYQSFSEPAEHVMCVINLAWQHVSTAHTQMEPQFEKSSSNVLP